MDHTRPCRHYKNFRETWKIIKDHYARQGKYEKLVDLLYCRNCGAVKFPNEKWIYPHRVIELYEEIAKNAKQQ